MYATIQDKKGNVKVVNEFGQAVTSKKRLVKSYGVLWETESGDWVKKIYAIKSGLKLTGNKKEFHLTSRAIHVPA